MKWIKKKLAKWLEKELLEYLPVKELNVFKSHEIKFNEIIGEVVLNSEQIPAEYWDLEIKRAKEKMLLELVDYIDMEETRDMFNSPYNFKYQFSLFVGKR